MALHAAILPPCGTGPQRLLTTSADERCHLATAGLVNSGVVRLQGLGHGNASITLLLRKPCAIPNVRANCIHCASCLSLFGVAQGNGRVQAFGG